MLKIACIIVGLGFCLLVLTIFSAEYFEVQSLVPSKVLENEIDIINTKMPEATIAEEVLAIKNETSETHFGAKVSTEPTELYSAQVDRVKVLFSQWDYVQYRLQTNELVREGLMNSERGFENDSDAVVYVLNWQAPVGEQILYVRLTAEPNYLYMLGSDRKILTGGRLQLE